MYFSVQQNEGKCQVFIFLFSFARKTYNLANHTMAYYNNTAWFFAARILDEVLRGHICTRYYKRKLD